MTILDYFTHCANGVEDLLLQNCNLFFKTPEAKKSVIDTCTHRLFTVAEPFVKKALVYELGKINPFLEIEPELATEDNVKEAQGNLCKELEKGLSLIPDELKKITLNNFVSFFHTFCEDFEKNKPGIESVLFDGRKISEIINLSEVSCSVLIVNTNEGKIVYKKHDCRNDIWLRRFVEKYFNGKIYVPKCFADSSSCGFCEFVKRQKLSEVDKTVYYENLGFVAALARGLGLSDLHNENIIPIQNVPAIIDCEMLFQPLHLNTVNELFYGKPSDKGYSYFLNRSSLEHCIIESQNGPLLVFGKRAFTEELKKTFFQGFSNGYRIFMKEKESILEEVEQASDCRIRKVIRKASFYQKWVEKLYTDKSGGYSDSIHNVTFPTPSVITEYELSFLKEGTYPYFCTSASSKNICSYDGKILIENFFSKSSVDMVRERLTMLSEENLEFEKSMINAVVNWNPISEGAGDLEFIEYWEKLIIKAPNGEFFWLNLPEKSQNKDLQPDSVKGSLAIAKRCAQIAQKCNGCTSLRQRAEQLVRVGLFSFERILTGDLNVISSNKLKEGFETVKYIKTCLPDSPVTAIVNTLEAYYANKA